MKTLYRITCTECSCEHDGTHDVSGWQNVERVQSLRDSRKPLRKGDMNPLASAWYTHLGLCPDCVKEETKK